MELSKEQKIESVAKAGGSGGATRKNTSAEHALMSANNLIYKVPPDLSVTNSRKLVKSFFQQSRYNKNQSAVCIINSGDNMVDGRNSYLQFSVERKATAAGVSSSWGSGSALNLINRVTITTASGVELDRTDSVNLIAYDMLRWTKTTEWFDTVGSLMGYGEAAKQHTNTSPYNIETYCIPLRYLSGLFSTPKMLYSGLMSGLKIEIAWENELTAMKFSGALASSESYEIVDPCIVLDSHQFMDYASRVLHEQSASIEGLEIVFPSYDIVGGILQSTETTLHQASRRAVSQANIAWLKSRPSTNIANFAVDSFLSEDNDVKSYQFNLGSLYFPNQPITDKKEMYANALYSWGQLSKDKLPSVTYGEFAGTGLANDKYAMYPVTIERSTMLESSGLPLVSGRALNVSATFNTGVQRQIDVVLQYTKVVKQFITYAVVKM
jgi:hypothetical protein